MRALMTNLITNSIKAVVQDFDPATDENIQHDVPMTGENLEVENGLEVK